MKWKSLAGLIVTFFLYLMIGAFVFMGVEKQPYVGNLTEVKMKFLQNKSGSIDMEDLDAFVEEVLQSVGVKTGRGMFDLCMSLAMNQLLFLDARRHILTRNDG